jgi:hypothetical protein
MSVGLSVMPRSNWMLPAGSREARDRAFEDDELVLAEPLRESFLRLEVSWVNVDGFLRSTFRGLETLSWDLPEDEEPEAVGTTEPERPDPTLTDEPHD